MRFVPLIRSDLDPRPWSALPAVELAWTGSLHPGWQAGPQVHAVHLPAMHWNHELGAAALALLRLRLEPDFLVLPAACPGNRQAQAQFLGVLEGLLEAAQGRRIKLALRPEPAETAGLARLLKEVHGEAVGFCWNGQTGADLDCISDRLFCAVGGPGDDLAPLQRLGYRWNLALADPDPDRFPELIRTLEQRYPTVYFPADLGPADPGPGLSQEPS